MIPYPCGHPRTDANTKVRSRPHAEGKKQRICRECARRLVMLSGRKRRAKS